MSQQSAALLGGLALLGLAWWHGVPLCLAWYSGVDPEIPSGTWWTLAATSAALAAAAVPLLWSAAR